MQLKPIVVMALLAGIAISGCSGQNAQQSAETATDSLLAANPVEEPAGDITPQSEFEQEKPAPTPPAQKPASKPQSKPAPKPAPPPENPGVTVPAGTAVALTIDAQVSSETAQAGDMWTGVVTQPVVLGTQAPIPAGSKVSGVVVASNPAAKGDRAFLVLAVRSITVDGKEYMIAARTDSIIAGSTRARNLGAIAGGAAAGALIGKAVGGSGKGALIGGLVGGAAATAGVAASKGYQVVLKEGTELTFHTNDAVVMK